MQRYNNYHKHTHYSNIRTLDCVSKPEDYIKRAVELGHTTYFTTEHGYQGNIYEAYKYGTSTLPLTFSFLISLQIGDSFAALSNRAVVMLVGIKSPRLLIP